MSPAGPAADRPPRGEARRALILEAALRVVGEEGASALTHRRVAAEAGLPVAATTYWFASKDELLAEAYRLAADRDMERIRELAAIYDQRAPDDLAATLADLLAADLAGSRTALLAAYSLWIEAARRPVLRGIERDWTHAYVAVVERVLRVAGSPHPATDAQLLVAALDGLLLAQLAVHDPDPAITLRPQLERLIDALLRAP